ncbi:ATP-binding cassette sub-family C member 4-like [Convolutriloba macropyga]|uniref:ATP-binding cassette sub-family C member 4-like n=1 Tax=Convolutriloba macropyga TaxID=536237 RepID=UPI003F520603
MIPIQLAFTSLFSKFRTNGAKYGDARVKLMREVIEGIRVIKMYVWEDSFKRLIKKLRLKEVNELIKVHVLNGVNYGINAGSPQLVTMATVLVVLYVHNDHLLPDVLFCYMLLMGDLKLYAQLYTLSLPYMAEINVAVKRIQNLIDIVEEPQFYVEYAKTGVMPAIPGRPSKGKKGDRVVLEVVIGDGRATTSTPSESDPDYVAQVVLNNVTATHDSLDAETNTGFNLKNVNFTAARGELVMVVGSTGSGKSSLLLSLIDEMVILNGTKTCSGSVAYSSQEAWIMAGTVQDNILFGLPLKPYLYNSVVLACSLTRDFEIMPDGDQTVVGERGVMLSGGQKARISLARAAYRDADIVLLDDPLSAVDTHVSKQLFEKCISGLLKDKIVILATHQLQYLHQATKVLLFQQMKFRFV